jgi:hypothetical protein
MKEHAPTTHQNHTSASNSLTHSIEPTLFFVYEIRVEGQLDSQWTEWFGGMTIAPQANGDTVLSGAVIDQAALYGLLKKVRDLGMTLVSVQRVERRPMETANVQCDVAKSKGEQK